MRATVHWAGASTASLALHALALAAMIVAFRPDPIRDPSVREPMIEVVSADVRSERAGALAVPSDPAASADPAAVRLAGGSIPVSASPTLSLPAVAIPVTGVAGPTLPGSVLPSTPATAADAPRPVAAVPADARRLAALAPAGRAAGPAAIPSVSAGSVRPPEAPRASPVRPVSPSTAPHRPDAASATPVRPDGEALSAVTPDAPSAARLRPEAASAAQVRPEAASAPVVRPDGGGTATPVSADGPAVSPLAPDAVPMASTPVAGLRAAEAIAPPTALTGLPASGEAIAQGDAGGPVLQPATPTPVAARGRALPATKSVAALAWTGTVAQVDPLSVAAVGAFVDPRTDASGLRDRVAATLGAVDCARVQTAFDPATGALEMRGHVPQVGLGDQLASALRAEIGSAIPILDRLQILPRPLCGLLSTLDAVGLPQSDDQVLDPRFIGPQGQVRTWAFAGGDRLVLDIRSPDYPATIYVDYFDARGSVVHLQPNEIVAAEPLAPGTPFLVGAPSGDRPSIDLTITPPYGQEIVVAFAASHPLFTGLRPLTEPARDYLAVLAGEVARARATHPGFKGEWAYFLVSTAERR